MEKYENGKIYSIRSFQTDKFYIGSTCNLLNVRLGQHKTQYKNYLLNKDKYNYISSFEIIKYDDCYIELLENYNCKDRNELNKREGELIRQHINNIVNKKIEGSTRKETNTRYYNSHLNEIKEQQKEYKINNSDKIKENAKQYKILNKDKLNDYQRIYKLNNLDKLKENHNCECGGKYQTRHITYHKKTKNHINFINNQV